MPGGGDPVLAGQGLTLDPEVTDGATTDIGFDHLIDAQCRLHARLETGTAHGIGQRHRVHDGRQHTHVVGRGTVHAGGGTGHATEDVAAADDHAHLDAEGVHFGDFADDAFDHFIVDAIVVVAHEGLARQFQHDA